MVWVVLKNAGLSAIFSYWFEHTLLNGKPSKSICLMILAFIGLGFAFEYQIASFSCGNKKTAAS
jgi:hypothetical protein